MRTFSRSRIVAALLGAGICLPMAARAQSQEAQSRESTSQDSSVADAARRSRDKKKNPSTSSKSPKVITDDDLDRRNFQPGQEGLNVGAWPKLETEPPSAQAVAAAEAPDIAADQDAMKEAKEQETEIARLKLQIAAAEKDLDLAGRQLALDQDTYFANADYAHDVAGKAKLDGEKQQINDQQHDIERLKIRLAAVEEWKSHRKPVRTQTAPPPAENSPQTGNPPRSENAPSAPPRPLP
jgi:hypothetical protein